MKRNGDSTHPWVMVNDTYGARLWFTSAHADTNLWAGMQWLDGKQQAAVNTVLLQHPPQLSLRVSTVWFLRVDRTSADQRWAMDWTWIRVYNEFLWLWIGSGLSSAFPISTGRRN